MAIWDRIKKTLGEWTNLNKPKTPVGMGQVGGETKEGLVFKSPMPRYLYKPPFGYPLLKNIPLLRRLAKTPFVEMAISTIVRKIANTEWDIEIEEGVPEDIQQQVKDFFHNPNQNGENFSHILSKWVRDLLEIDAGVIIKVKNLKKETKEIYVRDGGMFLKNPDIYGVLPEENAYYQYGYTTMAQPIPFNRDEVIYAMLNPRPDGIYGQAPLEVLLDIVQLLIYSVEKSKESFSANMIPKGIISLKDATPEAVEAFKRKWEMQRFYRDKDGTVRVRWYDLPVSNTETDFVRLEYSNAEMEYISQQQWFSKIVWAVFGITPTEVGFTENSNKATDINQSSVFMRKTIIPILNTLEFYLNTQLINDLPMVKGKYENKVKIKFKYKDLNEERKKREILWQDVARGIKTPNEAREEIGLQPIEDGDLLKGTSAFNPTSFYNEYPFSEEKKAFDHKYVKKVWNGRRWIYYYRNPLTGELEEHPFIPIEKIRKGPRIEMTKWEKEIDAELGRNFTPVFKKTLNFFKFHLGKYGPKFSYRLKAANSIAKKLKDRKMPKDIKSIYKLGDILGFCIKANNKEAAESFFNKFKKFSKVIETEVKMPTEDNPYAALHIDYLVDKEKNIKAELQIKTKVEDMIALLSHNSVYKPPFNITNKEKKIIKSYLYELQLSKDKYEKGEILSFPPLPEGFVHLGWAIVPERVANNKAQDTEPDPLAPKEKAFALWGVDTFDTIDENPYPITETDDLEDARQYAKTFKGKYDWIIIVPKEPGPREIVDLNPEINEIVEEFTKLIPQEPQKKALTTATPLTPKEAEQLKDPKKIEKEINKQYKKIEKEIIDLVKKYLGNEAVQQKAINPQELVNKILVKFNLQPFVDLVLKGLKINFFEGVEAVEKEVNMNIIPNIDYAGFLENYTFDNIKSLEEETKNRLKSVIQRSILEQKTIADTTEDIKKALKVSQNRAKTIAQTELARARNQAQFIAWKQTGKKVLKKVVNPAPESEICKHLAGTEIPINQKFRYKGDSWEAPPFHPNCKSFLEFREVDDK